MVSSIDSTQQTVNFNTVPKSMVQPLKDFLYKRNIETLTDEDYAKINDEFLESYNKMMDLFSFKTYASKEEFGQSIEILYKTTVCGMKVYNPDYPGLDKIDMKKMPFDIDKEFENI